MKPFDSVEYENNHQIHRNKCPFCGECYEDREHKLGDLLITMIEEMYSKKDKE